jgi:hypothetical protein
MTDREFAFKRLTEGPIESGKYKFIFEHPDGVSFLCRFSIFNENVSIFSTDYLVKEPTEKTLVRIKMTSDNKKFKINQNKLDKGISVDITSDYLELTIEDFLHILSNEQWVVDYITDES